MGAATSHVERSPPAQDMEQPDPSAGNRLGSEVIPQHYTLTIQTDLVQLRFSGTVEIVVIVSSTVPSITLNAASPLAIHNAILAPGELHDASLGWQQATSIAYDTERERASISFTGGDIVPGVYRLAMRFDGELNRSMMGYYASAFPLPNGTDGFYAVTQFQPTSARRAFPCFDEPLLKATYTISLISRVDTVSLSNMDMIGVERIGGSPAFPRTDLLTDAFFSAPSLHPAAATASCLIQPGPNSTKPDDDWEIVYFRATPRVSSYLVVFANGPFQYREASYTSTTGRVVPLRMYATAEIVEETEFALAVTKKILPIYEKLFDIPFPLPKLDTLVVHEFDLGAMENWGCITGRTSVYLFNEKKSGIAAKKAVASTTSHEISHHHNDGMVVFFYEPAWKASSTFISDHLARALNLDAARSSHPIEQPCPDEATIVSIFDAISYSKGGSVLKMLKNVIGEETFLKGVTLYLKAHLYGSAETKDLWAGISEASGRDIGSIMHSWTTQIGFPLVTVLETKKGIRVRQNRFLNTADPTPEEDRTLWQIPLELKVVKDGKVTVDHDAMLSSREMDLLLPNVAKATFKLNAETAGVYRVLYSPERLAMLGDVAGQPDSAFGLSDRMGLVQDACVLASSGYCRTSTSLSLISKLANETEGLVWAEMATALAKLSAVWWDQPEADRAGIEKFRKTLLSPVASRLGFEYGDDDDADTIELRTLAISTAVSCGDQALLSEYQRRFKLLLTQNDESLIPSDLRRSIFTQCIANGGEAEYGKVLDIYRAAPTPSHKSAAAAGLCAATKPTLLKKSFNMLSSGEVKSQDYASFLGGLAANPLAKRDAWAFFKEHYDEIVKRFAGNFAIASVVKVAFQSLSSYEDAQEIEAFFETRDISGYPAAVSQGLDAVRSQAGWIERDSRDVHTWLEQNGYL